MTSWSQWRRGRFWAEVVLAVVVGVAAFVVAAVVSTAARSHVPAALLGLFLLLVVLAVARFAGILYALPVGVVTIEAFDWYFLPPPGQGTTLHVQLPADPMAASTLPGGTL